MSVVSRQEALRKGLTVYCDSCKVAYKAVPLTETEYGNQDHECPHCGGEIFYRIEDNRLPKRDDIE